MKHTFDKNLNITNATSCHNSNCFNNNLEDNTYYEVSEAAEEIVQEYWICTPCLAKFLAMIYEKYHDKFIPVLEIFKKYEINQMVCNTMDTQMTPKEQEAFEELKKLFNKCNNLEIE